MRIGSLYEGVVLALDQLRANKFRSALTILGIVIGVATVMAMSGLVTGIRSGIMEGMEAAGPKNFMLARFDWNEVRITGDGSGPPWGDNPKVLVSEARRLKELSTIKNAIVDVDASATISAGKEKVENVNISCDDVGWQDFTAGTFIAGHNFLPTDVAASRPVVVLSKQLAASLFGTLDPVGRTVKMSGKPFTVIGVYEVTGNIFANLIKNFAIVPYTTGLKHLNVDDEFLGVLVVTTTDATQAEAMDQATAALRTMRGLRPGDPNNFALIKQEEMLRTFNRVTGIFFAVMIGLSSVALMVGGVGVIAVMMIAVTERTREIGVRKALGATRQEILWQFLVEAVTLTLVGAAIGLALGGGLALLVGATTPIPAKVPAFAVAAALVMAGISGVLFGIWPAWRAARLDPVVALRYE